jgi:hypothetical protein
VNLGSKSAVGSATSLARRPGVGQFLRAVSPRARLVMGDVLARGRRSELDSSSMGTGIVSHT